MNLMNRLEELYDLYGFYMDSLHVYKLPGIMGEMKMKKIMDGFRKKQLYFGNMKVKKINDYNIGINGLPRSNVLEFFLGENSKVIIRPSGTESKIKVYISIFAKTKEIAEKLRDKILIDLETKLMIGNI